MNITMSAFLTEIRDLYSKDGLSGKDMLFSALFVQVGLGRQHTDHSLSSDQIYFTLTHPP